MVPASSRPPTICRSVQAAVRPQAELGWSQVGLQEADQPGHHAGRRIEAVLVGVEADRVRAVEETVRPERQRTGGSSERHRAEGRKPVVGDDRTGRHHDVEDCADCVEARTVRGHPVERAAHLDQSPERGPALAHRLERVDRPDHAGGGIEAEDRPAARPLCRTVERAVRCEHQRAHRRLAREPGDFGHLSGGREADDAGGGDAVEVAARHLHERTVRVGRRRREAVQHLHRLRRRERRQQAEDERPGDSHR